MGASQSQQSQPISHSGASQPSSVLTTAHQTVDTTAAAAHSAIDTVATTAEQAKHKAREAEQTAKQTAEDVKRAAQQKKQEVKTKAEDFKQQAAALTHDLTRTAEQKAEEARQAAEQVGERARTVWQRIKDNIRQRCELQYRCPAMDELQSTYHEQLSFRPLPLHRLVVKSPNLLDECPWRRGLTPSLELLMVSTAERADTLLGRLSYSGVRAGVLDGPKAMDAVRAEALRGEATLAVPTNDWRTTRLVTDNAWSTENLDWRTRHNARLGQYSSVTNVQSPTAAFTFRWDYCKEYHTVASGVSATVYHEPLIPSAVVAAVCATSKPFNNTTLAARKPAADALTALVHYVQPQYMADVQASIHPASGQLHSYAARALFRSSPLGIYPHCKVGIMLSDRAELEGRDAASFDSALLLEAVGGCGSVDAACYEQPVLSSCVVYSPSGTVDWKCRVASDGHIGAMMQRQLAPTIGVEVSVAGNVITRNKAAVGVGVTLG